MKIQYEEPKNFQKKTLEIIATADTIMEGFRAQGYDITVRQLHYRFVATQPLKKYWDNINANYSRLKNIVGDARMCGLLAWDLIVDRERPMYGTTHWDNPLHLMAEASKNFAIDKWEDQRHHVEVWVEKSALRGVVGRVCAELDLDYFSCRGYPSKSAVWRASERFLEHQDEGREPIILHLGDHDPSGLDMTRDIRDRLHGFGVPTEVKRIGLNFDQVTTLKLPPNFVKKKDSRGPDYIRQYGDESWELDALEPSFLADLIRHEVDLLRDDHTYSKRQKLEVAYKADMKRMLSEFGESSGWMYPLQEKSDDRPF